MFVLRGVFVREFFVGARVWCVPCRVSRVACIGGVHVFAAVGTGVGEPSVVVERHYRSLFKDGLLNEI